MHAIVRSRHKERVALPRLVEKMLDQVARKEGRVSGNGAHMTRGGTVSLTPLERRMHAGQRSGETGDAVRYDRQPIAGKARAVSVGIDNDFRDLRLQTLNDAS